MPIPKQKNAPQVSDAAVSKAQLSGHDIGFIITPGPVPGKSSIFMRQRKFHCDETQKG